MIHHLFGLRTPLRDGLTLVADVYLPARAIERWPTVVIRTPYGKQNPLYTGPATYLAEHGYAVFVQDVRGRGDSEGEFYPFFNNEGPDGYDTIEWVAEQPWSNGRIGMMSGSYCGWVQWCAAALKPPHLVTMVSASAAARWFQQVPFHNGVAVALPALAWLFGLRGHVPQDRSLIQDWSDVLLHLPLYTADEFMGVEMPVWKEWLRHSTFDEFWQSRRLQPEDFAAVTQPVLHITSTYDGTQPGALFVWEGAQAYSPASGEQRMLFGHWDHLGAASSMQKPTLGGVDFGPDSALDINDLHRRWFDRWLKEIPTDEFDTVAKVFFTGINQWKSAGAWPPPGDYVSWYLHSGGAANSASGDGMLTPEAPGEETADAFSYDPHDPVLDVPDLALHGRPDPLHPLEPPLVRDFVERREDVLVYTSAPLEEALTVAGEPRIVLFGGSDAPDTEWHAWLADVAPDGTSMILVRGQMGARFRESLSEEHLMEPGVTYCFEFEMLSLAHVFRAGHCIRLAIASSDFPTYARCQNTGHPIGMDAEVRVARNVVAHSGACPSRILLPTMLHHAVVDDVPGTREGAQW